MRALAAAACAMICCAHIAPGPVLAQSSPQLESPDRGRSSPALPDRDEDLSERLKRSDGVIRPPEGVAPDMRVPPKDSGAGATMPIIPPPRSPQGDGRPRPK